MRGNAEPAERFRGMIRGDRLATAVRQFDVYARRMRSSVWCAVLIACAGCKRTEQRVPGEKSVPFSKTASTPPPSCKSDLDCGVCGTRTGCHCVLAGSPECGPMEHPCVVAPCAHYSGSCWNGKCAVRPAAAAPCASDGDCEVRDDDCKCEVFPGLVSAPPSKACADRDCATRPAKSQYRARCDSGAKRCVLERK